MKCCDCKEKLVLEIEEPIEIDECSDGIKSEYYCFYQNCDIESIVINRYLYHTNKYWKSNSGLLKISEMNTGHLINTVKYINKMAKKGHKYPDCYDNMYEELEERGVDTDFEMDEIFKKL